MEVSPESEVLSPIALMRHLGSIPIQGADPTMFALFAAQAVNPTEPRKLRVRAFNNALGWQSDTAEGTLAFLDAHGAGPEAHVAAAYAGYYDSIPGELVRVVEE